MFSQYFDYFIYLKFLDKNVKKIIFGAKNDKNVHEYDINQKIDFCP